MSPIDDELSPELALLFDAERRRDDVPPGAKDRVHQALAASIGAGFSAGAGSGAAKLGAAAKGSGAAAAKVAAASTAGAAAGATATGGVVAKGLAVALVAAMAGTAGTGIWLARRDDPPPPPKPAPVVAAPPPAHPFDPAVLAPPPPLPPSAPAPAPVPRAPHVTSTPRARPVERPAPRVESVETPEERATRLAGERTVLDQARMAVARGDGGAALIALEAHRDRYPDGALVEEREALTVLALVKLGRVDQAKAKADRFRARFPKSLFLGAIDDALR